MKINSIMPKAAIFAAAAQLIYTPVKANYSGIDTFEKTEIPASGSSDSCVLAAAPNPSVEINGVKKQAKIVVDLKTNTLYKYTDGIAEAAYKIASGSERTPTHKGVRIVTHTEKYPFRGAPRWSKRRRNPSAYGPKIICLNRVNTETGEQSSIGEFIHGTNNPSSIGKYISHGCMRMDNDVILALSTEVKRGDIVIIR